MKELASQGIGVSVKQADPLTPEQDVLWDKNFLGPHSSKSYINTVIYYNCKLFGLRGLDEHRKLEVCQLKCDVSDGKTYIEFCGRTSRNFAGGLHQRNILAKSIRHFSESGTPRSLYGIYASYISMVEQGKFLWMATSGTRNPLWNSTYGGSTSWEPLSRPCVLRQGSLGTFQTTQGNALVQRPCFSPVSCMI